MSRPQIAIQTHASCEGRISTSQMQTYDECVPRITSYNMRAASSHAREQNYKIVNINNRTHRLDVYNYKDGRMKSFANVVAMMNYYSDNAKFIDFATSSEISRFTTIRDGRFSSHKNIFYCYKEPNITMMSGYKYKFISGDTFPDPRTHVASRFDEETMFYEFYTTFRLMNIRIQISMTGSNNDDERNAAISASMGISGEDSSTRTTQPEINTNLIYGYHTRMSIDKKRSDLEIQSNSSNKRFFGIELEIDMERNRRHATETNKHRLATKLNSMLNINGYNDNVKFERDSSLGVEGFEIITQPMTFCYIMQHKQTIIDALKAIDNAGYSSHDSGRCGMHIHISRTELQSDALDNAYMLFENFKNELIAFSRRKQTQMQWTKFISDETSLSNITKEYITHNKRNRQGHYVVLNNGNDETVEFRLFRGTTKPGTFFANIQLVDNIVTMSNEKDSIEGITWDDIINYNPSYTELKEYNESRHIFSKHKATNDIQQREVSGRPVVLVRPFQLHLAGDDNGYGDDYDE